MSEIEAGVGATLRAAREARGLSVADAAQQLRLMNRQIVAMEEEDYASLGQPVFARGFVRNYARMLGLDDASLLRAMGGAPATPVEVNATAPLELPRKWFTSGWLIAGMVLLLLVTVLPIGLYAWLSSDAEETPPLTRQPATAPVAASISPPNTPASPAPVQNMATQTQPAGAATAVPPANELPVTIAPAQHELRFELAGDAWLEVKDGAGHTLTRQIHPKDSELVLAGQPPFTLTVGNATQVRMSYKGRPLDLTPYINANVARFSLEE